MPGTLGAKREYIMDGKPVHPKAPCVHTFPQSFTPRSCVTEPNIKEEETGEQGKKLSQIREDSKTAKLQTDSNLRSGRY